MPAVFFQHVGRLAHGDAAGGILWVGLMGVASGATGIGGFSDAAQMLWSKRWRRTK